jgi:hypothetical protein
MNISTDRGEIFTAYRTRLFVVQSTRPSSFDCNVIELLPQHCYNIQAPTEQFCLFFFFQDLSLIFLVLNVASHIYYFWWKGHLISIRPKRRVICALVASWSNCISIPSTATVLKLLANTREDVTIHQKKIQVNRAKPARVPGVQLMTTPFC